MTIFTATFSNGHTITRNNKTGRVYTHAYRAHTSYLNQVRYGFAASAQQAERAGRANFAPKFFADCDVEVVPVSVTE